MGVPFDTLAVTRELTAKGFDSGQAEAITGAVRAGVTGGVATKADIAELIAEVREDNAALRTGLRWVTGIGAGVVAVLIGVSGFGFNMLVGMTADIATLQADIAAQGADIATLQAAIIAQGADIAAIKEALTALASSG